MSNHKSLVFFNKEGDYLNIKYNNTTDRFEGDLLFHESSSDIYKTYGLYTMEHLPAFEYASPVDLTLGKFQIFNEWGMHFYGAKTGTFIMNSVEPVNNDPGFYSKWIYGNDFERFFPIGTFIMFDSVFLEFQDTKKTFAVIGSKKGAVMILTDVDNATFESMYYVEYTNGSIKDVIVRGSNLLGIYNYIDADYKNNLSEWNETNFYEKYYTGKKISVVNSVKNDGVYTVKETEVTDAVHFEYYIKNIEKDKNLLIELVSKTDVPKIYDGGITITNGRINFKNINAFPKILKPGREFKIVGSTLNTNFITVADIPNFANITELVTYSVRAQVLYNNNVYQCIKSYTQDYSNPETQGVTPEISKIYWGRPTYVSTNQNMSDETINNCQIYLTTDRLYFEQGYTQSSSVTLAMAAEKYKDDFNSLNIDLYTKKGVLKADLMYPSKYAEVNFYHTEPVATCLFNLGDRESFMIRMAIESPNKGGLGKSPKTTSTSVLSSTEYLQLSELYDKEVSKCNSYLIGNQFQTNERLVEIQEQFKQELNYDYSENYKYNIVFTDIDEFGIKLIINKQTYEEEINWIYSGAAPDMQRTIDRTLRNWLTRNHVILKSLGIIVDLEYLGSYVSPFYNAIIIRSEYPNVPIEINRIEVGTTADYHIEHSKVLFNAIGGNLLFTINSKPYDIQTIYGTFLDNTGATVSSTASTAFVKLPDIPKTLTAWVEEHAPVLETYGIIVKNINNLLKFDIKRTDRRLDYTIKTGKLMLPGQTDYIITKKIRGNKGTIVTGNETKLTKIDASSSFEDAGFGTGRIIGINSTPYPLQNIKYNLLSVDPKRMSLSYQGPFWGLEPTPCKSSGFITLAFDLGFGQTTCITGPEGEHGGPFNTNHFQQDMYAINYNKNDYDAINYDISGQPGISNLVDMKYIQLSNSVFVLGDNLIAMDAYTGVYLSTIYLTGNVDSIEMEFNTFNNYLYCLSKTMIWVVDPVLNLIVTSITLTSIAADMLINIDNGDIYVTYEDNPTISIFDYTNTLITNIITPSISDTKTGKMVYNEFEKDIYITTDSEILIRVNGSTRDIQTSYSIPGLTQSSIFYEPVNESIYVYAQTQLWRIDNGVLQSVPGMVMSEFVDVIYNNLTGEMNVSDKTFRFRSLNLTDNSINIDRNPSIYGKMALNQYDGGVYLASDTSKKICVIDSANGVVIHTETTQAVNKSILYNQEDKSIWTLQPSISNVFVIKPTVNSVVEIITATGSLIDEGQFGTLDPNYVKPTEIWLKAYECVRKPRENFEGEKAVKYYWRWLTDENPEFFIYDLSGEQLEKTGPYAYTGPKPFKDVPLNKYPNRDVNKVGLPEHQQTVFDRIEHELSYIDDQDDVSTEPTPLQLFLGFKAPEEGVYSSYLQLYKKEEVEFSITSTPTNDTIIYFDTIISGIYKSAQIKLNTMSEETFIGRGLKVGQYIKITIKDITNTKDQWISKTNGYVAKIIDVFNKTLVLGFLNVNSDYFESEKTVIWDYPKSGNTTYLKTTFTVIDREIARFKTLGQTEIEDPRFKIELGNVGKNIGPNEIFIFKDYDILEGGVDWNFLNMKRKELLMMKHLIYPYIGSYKSIINAINFFGYNDLQLNEYYRNINTTSENFLKLFKVEIPDIFDNTVEGWTDNDFMKHTFPNENFEETNLFNLTYFITDKEGNKIITYSLDDITIKLQGLKFWLKNNIIPLTHKILDITGRSYFTTGTQITHRVHDIRIINIKENMTPISFKLNEAYLMPVNSGSTIYNCVLDFYTIIDGLGADKNPTGLRIPPKPYYEYKDKLIPPEYFTIKIRTYKTYKEWAPFSNYMKGDKITYYGKIYESVIDNNKIKSPRKHEDVKEWNANDYYTTTSLVKYNRDLFVYSGLGATYSAIPPILDQGDDHNWLNITEWREIDLEPVQTIDEYRRIPPPPQLGATHSIISMKENGPHKTPPIAPFNFAIDSNIDPFIVVEISSENGYGLVYRDRKNYEIRGIKDLVDSSGIRDIIGPFEPITPIY
jgi:hypothetical protein